jgi:energy-coupling factor transport system substrate-specific component
MIKSNYFKVTPKTIIAIIIGSLLYGLSGTLGITIEPRAQIRISIYILSVYSIIFGPVVGFFAGFIGHVLTDYIMGYGWWLNWELSSGIFGFCAGLICIFEGFDLKKGLYKAHHIQMYCLFTIYGFLFGYTLSGAIDILVLRQSIMKVMLQVLIISGINTIVILFLSVPTIIIILRRKRKKYQRIMQI